MGNSSQRQQVPLTILPLNTITPYLRARFEVSDDVVRWETPRTVLGVIPIGIQRVALPLPTVTATRAHYAVRPVRALLVLVLLAALLVWPSPWVLVPAAIAAVAMILLAPCAELEVRTAQGRRHRLGVCLRHRLDVDLIAAALDDLTGHRPARRRTYPPTG